MAHPALIHPTAVVDDGAEIGDGVRIWHWAHVRSGARIGAGSSLGQNVYVGEGVRIGKGVKVQNNVSVYEGVVLEDFVFCGPSAVFTNVINPRAEIERKHEFKETIVRRGATLGANCTIVCGVKIGAYAFVGAGAVVVRDVQDFSLVAGNPARPLGWISRSGGRLDLPLEGEGSATCPISGERYQLERQFCRLLEPVAENNP
jgi:UDP-2-acetamido-3-amino-2,3-dideoxy-glucuronate N-acetyltransferase